MKRRGVPDEPDYLVSLSSVESGREPFADSIDDELFCFDPGRNQRLNLLLHLAPYSELLLVTGEPGSGKTSLLRQFALRAASRWKIARVVADTTMSVDMLVRRIGDEAGVVLNDPGEDPLALLADHIRMLGLADKSLILIIDDAHELSGAALAIIDRLLEVSDSSGRPLTVILSGGPQTQDLLNHPERKALARRCSHTLDVPALTEAETGDYIRHRLTVCGYDPAAFVPATIRKIYKASGGIPARINELAGAELAQLASMPQRLVRHAESAPRRRFGHFHWLAAAVVLVALFFYWPAGVEQPPLPPADTAPESAQRDARRDAPPAVAPPPALEMAPEEAADATAVTAEDLLIELPPDVDVTALDDADVTDVVGPDDATPLPPGIDTAPAIPDSGIAAVTEPIVTPPPVAGPPAVPAVPEPAMVAVPPVAAAPPSAAPLPVVAPPPAAPPVAPEPPAPAVAPPAPPPAATAGAPQREDWLLQQPPSHFTLQLMSSDKEESIVRFINKRQLGSDTAYFRLRRDGKDWYAVVYSAYPSREAAAAAAAQLPANLADIKPWIRGMDSIHTDIKAADAAR